MAEIIFLSDEKIDEYYLRQVGRLRAHYAPSANGPNYWRHSFEDVLASCLRYLEGKSISKKYKYIQSFTRHAHQAMKIINDRDYVKELKLHDRRLSKIFIKCVCIERIYREDSSSPEKRKEFIDLYERYIDFYIPTPKFTQSELDKIRFFGKQSFGRRWSGYENFG